MATALLPKKVLKMDSTPPKGDWWRWEIHTLQLLFQGDIEKEGLSWSELAERIGVHYSTINRLMTKAWVEPRYSTILKIAKGLKYQIKYV